MLRAARLAPQEKLNNLGLEARRDHRRAAHLAPQEKLNNPGLEAERRCAERRALARCAFTMKNARATMRNNGIYGADRAP